LKKAKSDDLRPEYRREDLGLGVRGKYLEASRASNLVLLSPDVAQAFPTEEAVNEALRSLIELARRATRPTKPSRRRSKSGEWSQRIVYFPLVPKLHLGTTIVAKLSLAVKAFPSPAWGRENM
jgi:hypothetical protein